MASLKENTNHPLLTKYPWFNELLHLDNKFGEIFNNQKYQQHLQVFFELLENCELVDNTSDVDELIYIDWEVQSKKLNKKIEEQNLNMPVLMISKFISGMSKLFFIILNFKLSLLFLFYFN